MHEPAVAPGKRRKRYAVQLGTGGRKEDVALTYIVANFEVAADAPWEELAPDPKTAEEVWPVMGPKGREGPIQYPSWPRFLPLLYFPFFLLLPSSICKFRKRENRG